MKKTTITTLVSLFALLSMFLASCVSPYDPNVQILPDYIKKIYVNPVINATRQLINEAGFTNEIILRIQMDGRLSCVNSEAEADCILVVIIKKYTSHPLVYDENNVPEQYKLLVTAQVSLIDKRNNVLLWAEPQLEEIKIYRDAIEGQRGATIISSDSDTTVGNSMAEDNARDIVWEKMAGKIVRKMIKGLKAVAILEEKVQKEAKETPACCTLDKESPCTE